MGDEEIEESLMDHDSDEIAIMYILLPNTNSIHDQPLDQPLYSVFRSHVLHIREVNQTLMKFNNGVLPISN